MKVMVVHHLSHTKCARLKESHPHPKQEAGGRQGMDNGGLMMHLDVFLGVSLLILKVCAG